MAQKYTEAQKQSARKWDAANLDRLSIALPKGSREAIKAHATAQGESTNAFIKRAIDFQMERDSAGRPQMAEERAAIAGGASISLAALKAAQAATQPTGAAQKAVASLSPDALVAAQGAAERTGETVAEFLARAALAQAKRDEISLHMGLNPATGEKLNGEA